jgi:hypothetical protein
MTLGAQECPARPLFLTQIIPNLITGGHVSVAILARYNTVCTFYATRSKALKN